MEFNNYSHFVNYCLKIAKNRDYEVCEEQKNIIEKFEIVVKLLENLKNINIIKLEKDILNIICEFFKNENFETAFSHMKYFINKIVKFSRNEEDFYYITTSLNTMFGLGVEFEEEFILSDKTRSNRFYPSRVRGLELIEEEEKIYTINEFDTNYKNRYGVYFIYNHEGEIVYIGKSSTCLLTRAFQSAKERNSLNFSKIELRECKNKSDVAIYESYYIALHKPKYNNDLIFNDIPSIKLPELEVSKIISRSVENEYVTYRYIYYKSRVMDIEEFLSLSEEGNACLATNENIEIIRNDGIYDKYEMKQKAYEDSMQQIKSSGRYTVASVYESRYCCP